MTLTPRVFCPRHSRIETRLRCNKCNSPICVRCLIHTPVGDRCHKCAHLQRHPTYQLSPAMYLRALSACVLLAGVCGALLGFLTPALLSLPFINLIAVGAIGYVVGEGVRLATKSKRGLALQAIGGTGTLLAYGLGSILGANDILLEPIGFLAAIVGLSIAATRLG